MMARLWMRRIGSTLIADGDESAIVLSRIPYDKPLQVEARQPRSYQHLKLYWTLCRRIADYLCQDDIDEDVIDALFKIDNGNVVLVRVGDEIRRMPGTVSYAMDQTKFSEYFEKVVRYIYETLKIPPSVVADLLVPQEAHDTKARPK